MTQPPAPKSTVPDPCPKCGVPTESGDLCLECYIATWPTNINYDRLRGLDLAERDADYNREYWSRIAQQR